MFHVPRTFSSLPKDLLKILVLCELYLFKLWRCCFLLFSFESLKWSHSNVFASLVWINRTWVMSYDQKVNWWRVNAAVLMSQVIFLAPFPRMSQQGRSHLIIVWFVSKLLVMQFYMSFEMECSFFMCFLKMFPPYGGRKWRNRWDKVE